MCSEESVPGVPDDLGPNYKIEFHLPQEYLDRIEQEVEFQRQLHDVARSAMQWYYETGIDHRFTNYSLVQPELADDPFWGRYVKEQKVLIEKARKEKKENNV